MKAKTIGKRVQTTLKASKGVWLDSPEVGTKILGFLNQVFLHAEALGMRSNNPFPLFGKDWGK